MLTKREIDRFKEIYHRKYGVEISDKSVIESGAKLLELIRLVAQPGIDKKLKELHLIT